MRAKLFREINKAYTHAGRDLSASSFVVVLGDFNFVPPGEVALRSPPSPGAAQLTSSAASADPRRWAATLAPFTEIFQPDITRFGPVRCPLDPVFLGSRLDRILVSLPAWALMQLGASARLLAPAAKCYHDGVSDHAPVRCSLSTKAPLAPHLRPIPRWITEHPISPRCVPILPAK